MLCRTYEDGSRRWRGRKMIKARYPSAATGGDRCRGPPRGGGGDRARHRSDALVCDMSCVGFRREALTRRATPDLGGSFRRFCGVSFDQSRKQNPCSNISSGKDGVGTARRCGGSRYR